MRKLSRTIPVVALAAFTLAPALAGQQVGSDWFKWYIGPEFGVTVFETPSQTKGAYFTAGGHFLIMSKRTGLLISVDEAIAKKQSSAFADTTSVPTGLRSVKFTDLRKFSAVVLAFPFRSQLQPFIGIGLGIMQTGTEYPAGGGSPTEKDVRKQEANRLGSYGFATVVLGVQARAGSALGLFGQAAVTTAPSAGKLITGSTYAFTGGLRISLGSSREDVSGNGY